MRTNVAWALVCLGCSSGDATQDAAVDAPAPTADASNPGPDAQPGLDATSDARDAAIDPCLGRKVCDDFESAMGKPNAPFKVLTNKGTVTVDTTKAHSGKQSIKVAIDATTPQDTYRRAMIAVQGAPLIPLVNDSVYGRFYITTDRIPDKTVHWTIAHGDGPIMGTMLSGTYNYGGMGNLMANYYKSSNPATDCWQTKAQDFPTQKWTCVAFQFDGKNSEMRFWLDGVEVPELHVIGTQKTAMTCTNGMVDGKWYAPQFQTINVGWESYQNDVMGAHTAWIDDVILDDNPIPCAP